MRIVLLYPPPWKVPASGDPPDPEDGPPDEFQAGDLDPNFWQMPYGLLSLAAQAKRAGHQVKVFNLSGFTWPRTEEIIAALDASLWGLSCWTANRRGLRSPTQKPRLLAVPNGRVRYRLVASLTSRCQAQGVSAKQ